MDFTKIKDRVQRLLIAKEHLKDDDNKLIANIWFEDFIHKGLDAQFVSARVMMKMIADGELTSTESIRRIRAKLQKDNPNLRGHVYNKRMEKQLDAQEQLGYGGGN